MELTRRQRRIARAEAFHSIVHDVVCVNPGTLVELCAGAAVCSDIFAGCGYKQVIICDHTASIEWLDKQGREYRVEKTCNAQIPFKASVIALHACGSATDDILKAAVRAKATLAVAPCCYTPSLPQYVLRRPPDNRRLIYTDDIHFYDARRLAFLSESGYYAEIRTFNSKLTPMNRVIIGARKETEPQAGK